MSGGKVEASIANIVNDLPNISWQHILYEAITNAIQANATKIKINFIENGLELEDTKKYIEKIIVEDNGEGFNDKNTKSFKEYKTQLKRKLGCKGIGRFLFLKEFDEVLIESLDKKIRFVIDNDILEEPLEEKLDKTIIILNKPKKSFVINLDDLKKDIEEHFIAYFKLLNDKNISIKIEIYENGNKKLYISNRDIPLFKSKEFKINSHEFIISYLFNHDKFYNEGYYCAGHRVVKKNSELENKKKFKFFKDFKFLFLFESDYFDNNVNDTRDDFTIYPKKKEQVMFHNLSWEDIHEELRRQIQIIAKENGIDIEKISIENLREAINLKPYLGLYLKDNENFLDTQTLINRAEKELHNDKEFLRKNKFKKEEFYKKLSFVTQTELAEYMYDRQKLIDRLKQLADDNNSIEAEIHNLFMKKGTEDESENYKTNALWLFDDRFMSYNKIFSDKRIKDIFPKLSDNLDRPDLLSIYSNTYSKDEITDIVVIELKRADKNITPAGAEEQLLKYARYINSTYLNNPIRIWSYAFLKFDEETVYNLEDKDYNKIPTHSEYPIYYKYHEKRNTIINFLDYKAIAYDADTRHKTFMKILRGETL